MMRVGIIGLGRMGLAAARRLATHGMDVCGYDSDPAAMKRAEEAGIATCDLSEVARASDVLVTLVSDETAEMLVADRLSALAGDGLLAGRIVAVMTTISPASMRDLAAGYARHGVACFDAPPQGSIPQAASGTLKFLIGGDDALIAPAMPMLEALSERRFLLGPVGSGMMMKLALNVTLGAYIIATGEALALGERAGLDREAMLDVLNAGPVATRWLMLKTGVIAGREPAPVTLDIASLGGDLDAALALLGTLAGEIPQALAMPLTMGAAKTCHAALAAGWGRLDDAELPAFQRGDQPFTQS